MGIEDEARNTAPRRWPFWGYLAVVTAMGAAVIALALSHLSGADFRLMGASFLVVAGLLFVGELQPLVTAGSPDENGVATSTAFVFALLIHWGLGVALLMQSIATVLADSIRRKAAWRTAFNVAQYGLSFAAAWGVFALLGHHPSPTHPLAVSGALLPVVFAAGSVYFFVNNALVSEALAIRFRSPFRSWFFDQFGYQVASTGALIGLAPIVVVVMDRSPALVPLLLLPLFAVYATAALSLERERQSLHDPLTSLPNRKLLVQRTTTAIEEAAVNGQHVALFLLDLDRFKEINDTLGHHVGDKLLQLVAQRLAATVRGGDAVARLGGDEFAVLVGSLEDGRTAVELADRVRAALVTPFHTDEMSFEVEASIGIAWFPAHGSDFESLLQRADVAMYVAKERNTGVEVYSSAIDRHSTMRLGMATELRAALEQRHLELHYQPKGDLRTGEVIGVEALLRWTHPERGPVPPDEFVPIAEQTGLMRRVTHFVVDTALAQLGQWWASGLEVNVAVNVSARDLHDPHFAAYLRERLQAYDVPARALMIEVTESVLMADPARVAATLLSLAHLGVAIALDDFGTGYSSLVHLKRLPVSEVKIDSSFVTRMHIDDDDAAIVRSIVDLASALGLRTVAEGVETQDAWNRLAFYGCDAAQGWFLAPAMPVEEMTDWLGRHRPVPTTGAAATRRQGAEPGRPS